MSKLDELGLSSYEAKVYRSLLGLGTATAAEISAASEVPRGRIYDVLNTLSARELLSVRESREPTEYVAVDPEEAADVLLAERKRDLAEQREQYEAMAASVGEELAPVVPTRSQFWPAALGSDAAVALIDQQFAIAEDRIRSVMSVPYQDVGVSQYQREIDAIGRHLSGRLDVKAIVSDRLLDRVPDALRTDMLVAPDTVAARVGSDLHCSIDVVDGETVFVHVTDPFGAGDRLGVIGVRDEAFAQRIEAAFEDTWTAAAPL